MANESDGSQAATVGTEHNVDASISVGNRQPMIDVSVLVDGEVLLARWYDKAQTGDSLAEAKEFPITKQTDKFWYGEPFNVGFDASFRFVLSEAFMTVTSMTGTVAIGDAVTGGTSGAAGVIEWMDDTATPTEIIMRMTTEGTPFQDAEQAQVDGSNYLTLNDATPTRTFVWAVKSL